MINCLELGGAQNMVLRLFDAFHAHGVESYLFSIDRNQEIPLSQDPEREAFLKKYSIFLSQADVHWGPFRKVFMGPYQWIKLYKVVKGLGIDVMMSFMERANILNLLSIYPKRKILSIRIHISQDLSIKAPLKKAFIKMIYPRLLKRAERINFNSLGSAGDFRRQFQINDSQISVIYNFLDIERLRDLSSEGIPVEYEVFYEGNVLITVGRLYPTKGHLHLLRAFKRIIDEITDVKLVILGSGPMKEPLEAVVHALRMEDRVLMPGYQRNPYPWISRATAFVLSSKEEGFPNALLEAIALGKPVISTDCPSGPREMLAPGTPPERKTSQIDFAPYGILTPPFSNNLKIRDVHEPLSREESYLADAMKRIIKDEDLRIRYSKAALRRATDFSVQKILPQWLELLGIQDSYIKGMRG